MKVILREDESGVSEVVGTILILAMTVVLFSTIILWVTSIPTPSAQIRVEILPKMEPIYTAGVEVGVSITLIHHGGEALYPVPTVLYVSAQRGGGPPQTDVVILHPYNGLLATPSGLLDGPDSVWDIGERWAYKNFLLRSTDQITVTVIDSVRGVVVWTGDLTAAVGTRPPLVVDKWADGTIDTASGDPVQAGLPFNLYARVIDLDDDLNPASVFATLTMWYGSGTSCESPQRMFDDGVFPDQLAGDGVFTLRQTFCTRTPSLDWDGEIILINATDFAAHKTTSRFTLKVVEPFTGGTTQTIPSQLWQYVGFIQVRAEEVWFTQMNERVDTSNRFSLGRVRRTDLNGNGGALFHLLMANHGNRTVFVDGFTALAFRSASSSNVQTIYIVCGKRTDSAGIVRCPTADQTRPANGGGLVKYPGTGVFTNFEYAHVFDINPLDQETGGAAVEILAEAKAAFSVTVPPTQWGSDSYFPSILVSGISGPLNMTYQQILAQWGPDYNPFDYLNHPNPAWRTQWYAQVIPFIAMTVI